MPNIRPIYDNLIGKNDVLSTVFEFLWQNVALKSFLVGSEAKLWGLLYLLSQCYQLAQDLTQSKKSWYTLIHTDMWFITFYLYALILLTNKSCVFLSQVHCVKTPVCEDGCLFAFYSACLLNETSKMRRNQ